MTSLESASSRLRLRLHLALPEKEGVEFRRHSKPVRAGIACLFFAAAETLQIQLQSLQAIPSQFVSMIPYLLTIVALAGLVGRSVPPAALGRAED